MGWTWGEAGQVAGFGVAVVFGVLAILATVLWVTGKVIRRIEQKTNTKDKES